MSGLAKNQMRKQTAKFEDMYVQIAAYVHEEASKTNSKVIILPMNPRTLTNEKATFELDEEQAARETAPLQQQGLSKVIAEINVSCKQSPAPMIVALLGFVPLCIVGVMVKFLGDEFTGQHSTLIGSLGCAGFLLIFAALVARAYHDKSYAIRLSEKLADLNSRFAQQSVRFDLLTWRYLMKWHRQHAGADCAIKRPRCSCLDPTNSCCYNLRQYALVIQGSGHDGYFLGAGDSISESDASKSEGSLV